MFIAGACIRARPYKLWPSAHQRGSKPGYLLFFISKNPVIQFLQCMQLAPISHFLAFYGAMIHHSISAVLMAGLSLQDHRHPRPLLVITRGPSNKTVFKLLHGPLTIWHLTIEPDLRQSPGIYTIITDMFPSLIFSAQFRAIQETNHKLV